VLTLLTAAMAASPVVTTAHDWNSPDQLPPVARPGIPAWPSTLWSGPGAGAPSMPGATGCHRAPAAFDLASGAPDEQRADFEVRRERYERRTRPAGALAESLVPMTSARPGASRADVEGDAAMADAPAPMLAPPPATFAKSDRAAADLALMPRPPRPPVDDQRPVTAGVVDDNADFGAYLDYRARHPGLQVQDLDVSERYRLQVQDARGRPVADADVRLYAAGQAQPLWARTDAGGQAWLHPAAAQLRGEVFEVQVHATGARGRALTGRAFLRRGQKDGLQVTLDGAGALPPAQVDLAFLVDATGSMGDEIAKLRRSMQAMADQIAQLPSRPSICWGLVSYRDRGDDYFVRGQDFTDDLTAFQRGLAALQADGGGDMPEALNEALHTAIHRLSWRGDGTTRLVVLVADAPPHLDYGGPRYADDVQAAQARGIKLLTIGASNLDPAGEYVFRQLAQYTGGRFVFLTYRDARDPSSGPGRETVHDVRDYSVETLDKLVVRLVREELARRAA